MRGKGKGVLLVEQMVEGIQRLLRRSEQLNRRWEALHIERSS